MSDIVRGTTVLAGPLETTFEITGDMVGGAYCVVRQTVKAGSLFWPHIHVNEDQVIVVLSGELGVRVGDEEWTASAGETVYRPKGLPHAVWNSGVRVAYQRLPRQPPACHAVVVHVDTARWSGWPVMPSGPNVKMVSGCTSSMISVMRSLASTREQPPSG